MYVVTKISMTALKKFSIQCGANDRNSYPGGQGGARENPQFRGVRGSERIESVIGQALGANRTARPSLGAIPRGFRVVWRLITRLSGHISPGIFWGMGEYESIVNQAKRDPRREEHVLASPDAAGSS